jgi:hypothetical protein
MRIIGFIITPIFAVTSIVAPVIMGFLFLCIGPTIGLYHVHKEISGGQVIQTLAFGSEPKAFVRPNRDPERVVHVGVSDPILDKNGFLSYKGKPFMVSNQPLNFEGMQSYVEHIEQVKRTSVDESWTNFSSGGSGYEKSFIVAKDTIAVVVREAGGSGCPLIYRILVVTKDSLTKVNSSTGCTAEEPIIEQDAKGQVVITTWGFTGPSTDIWDKIKAFSGNNVFKYTYGKTL